MHRLQRLGSMCAVAAALVIAGPGIAHAAEEGDMVDYPLVFPVLGGADFDDTFGAPRDHGGHEGQDLFAAKGTPVLAAATGTVDYVNFSSDPDDLDPDRCCSIVLRHADGWESWYLHLNNDAPGTDDGAGWGIAEDIVPGAAVTAGQVIGWVGDSGNAEDSGPHLHFELHDSDDIVVNPHQALVDALADAGDGILEVGDSGPSVETLQTNLAAAGFDSGPIDGDFGPKTEAAVVAFQARFDLVVDGVVGPQTQGTLSMVLYPTDEILRVGDIGAEVAVVQLQLAAAGFDSGPADGIFGPKTLDAVLAFQAEGGLVADGLVGPVTRGALLLL